MSTASASHRTNNIVGHVYDATPSLRVGRIFGLPIFFDSQRATYFVTDARGNRYFNPDKARLVAQLKSMGRRQLKSRKVTS